MIEIEQLMWLVFAHFVGDWALQPLWIGTNKGKYWFIMTSHCMVYTACVSVALKYIGVSFIPVFALVVFVSHYLIDQRKCKVSKQWICISGEEFPTKPLYIDQSLHLFILLLLFIVIA